MNKKLFSILIAGTVLIAGACSSMKPSAPVASSPSVTDGKIKGNWLLNTVTFEGLAQNQKITNVFDVSSPNCFQGSTWTLMGNYDGSYTLHSSEEGCSAMSQKIVWSIVKQGGNNYFQFKKIEGAEKGKQVHAGYRLEVQSVDASYMVLKAPVETDSGKAYVVYSFSKTGKPGK